MKLLTNYSLANHICASIEMCINKGLMLSYYFYIAVLEII